MKPVEQLAYYEQHPPRCLAGVSLRPARLDGATFDGHRFSGKFPDELVENLNVIFQVLCPCGNESFLLTAEAVHYEISFHGESVYADRYRATCERCGKETDLSEARRNGYDAEIMPTEIAQWRKVDAQGVILQGPKQVMIACGKCDSHIQHIYLRFEYHTDLFEQTEWAGRTEDFYGWHTLLCACTACSTLRTVADFECA